MRFITCRLPDGVEDPAILSEDGRQVWPLSWLGLSYETLSEAIPFLTPQVRYGLSLAIAGIPALPVEAVTLESPIPAPAQDVICLGINYMAHSDEAEKYSAAAFATKHEDAIYFSKRVTRAVPDGGSIEAHTEKEKKLLNKLAYVWQGTEIMRKEFLFNNWRYRFQVRFDDEEQWYEATSVIVGKSRYYAGRYNLFNGASLSSPLLHAALYTGDKRGDFIRYAACIDMDALTQNNEINIRAAKKIEIRCNEENFAAELDGDAVTTAPLLIEMESEPIKFLA